MRHEEREREETSEPIFGTESPIVSPYPRSNDAPTPEIPALGRRVGADLSLIGLGAISAYCYASPTGLILFLSILFTVGIQVIVLQVRSGLVVAHEAIAMTTLGYFLTIWIGGWNYAGSQMGGPLFLDFFLFVIPTVASVSLILIFAAARHLKSRPTDPSTYGYFRRGVVALPIVFLLEVLVTLAIPDQEFAVTVRSSGQTLWVIALVWSVTHPTDIKKQLAFGLPFLLTFLAPVVTDSTPYFRSPHFETGLLGPSLYLAFALVRLALQRMVGERVS